MLKTRIAVALILISIFAAVMYFGGWVQYIAFTLAALLSVHELLCAFKAKGKAPWGAGAYVFAGAYCAVYFWAGLLGVVILTLVCVAATMAEGVFKSTRTVPDVICSLLIFIYPLLFYAILMGIAGYGDSALRLSALLITFAGPLVGDTGAYFVGCTWGKHKLCPHISPKKTVEGSLGGFLGGVLGGVFTYYVQSLWGGGLGLVPLCVLGFICGGLGQIGDLFASFIKRWAGIKDFGNLLPGHGGILDRLDSVLMCGPVVFIYLYAIYGIL